MHPPLYDQHGASEASLMDHHLYNQAIFSKFQSLVT
jgi:phosphatidylinositol glycan class Q protein